MSPIDVLFISELPIWPRDLGWRVHGLAVMREMVSRDLRVGVATMTPTRGKLPRWLANRQVDWPQASDCDIAACRDAWRGAGLSSRLAGMMRFALASHQALQLDRMAVLATLVRQHQVRAVVALGQHAPMLLWGLSRMSPNTLRLWHAADDPVLHQLSCLRCGDRQATPITRQLRHLAVAAATQMLFTPRLHAAIAASPLDQKFLRRTGRLRCVPLVRNGVDLDYFHPGLETDEEPMPFTAAFWGRLDFAPNADAVKWFVAKVWRRVHDAYPGATFFVIGKGLTPALRKAVASPGVDCIGEVKDVRDWARRSAVVVAPLRYGHGIKNKLLEAAALARPILATPAAVAGLNWPDERPPFRIRRSARGWAQVLGELWTNPAEAEMLRWSARRWVEREHRWDHAAGSIVNLINSLLPCPQRLRPASTIRLLQEAELPQAA